MRILNFNVDGQRLKKDGDFSGIIKGSKRYLNCQFSFMGNDWLKHKIVAIFECEGQEYPVAVINHTCTVPNEVTDASFFKLNLVGARNDHRMITNKVIVEQR